MPVRYTPHSAVHATHLTYTDLSRDTKKSLEDDLDRIVNTLETAESITQDLKDLKRHGEPRKLFKFTDSDRQYYIQLQIDANKSVCDTLRLIVTAARRIQRGDCTAATYSKALELLTPLLRTYKEAANVFNQRLHILHDGKRFNRPNIPDLSPLAHELKEYESHTIGRFMDTLEKVLQHMTAHPARTGKPSEAQ